ncbi:MAG: endonuclease MutS2 [Planctomycetota bacterium]|jgi:DNA mismatch repair protein MutS2
MDAHTLRVLEFDKILEKAAAYAGFAPGREMVLQTRPQTRVADIRKETDLVSEVKDIVVSTGRFPLEELRDIRGPLRRVRPEGAHLDGPALREIALCLASGRVLRTAVERSDRELPVLTSLVSEIRVFPDLEKAIRRAIDEEGRVADNASPELAAIRKRIRILDERIRSQLESYIHSQEGEVNLQEKFVTLRDGRHVLPVKAERKTEVLGIIHGRSDTGNTIFIEPLASVELGNERRDLAGQEAAEVRRILRTLTEAIRVNLPDLEHNLTILARADAARAKANLSEVYGMHPAQIEAGGTLRLIDARHPLLVFQGAKAVPLDLSLSPTARTLVISGPNTGGKTVALKTLGLLCLMAQAGLHVPAGERSVFPLFHRILADIGDDQSIEASLSTFSSHISRIVEILDVVEPESLILLDEMGAATDPHEGGALAGAILKHIHDTGAVCVATTHLATLKALAHEHEGMENAGMAFDEKTGRPTYRLKWGTPGTSRALATARSLGLPGSLLTDAEDRMGSERTAMERFLEDLQREVEQARSHRENLEEELTSASAARQDLEERLAHAEREHKAILKQAHLEAETVLREFREEGERVLGEIKEIRKAPPKPGAKEKARIEQRRLAELGRRARSEAKRLTPAPEGASDEPVQVGQTVALRTMKGFGTVKRLDEKRGRAEVDLDGMTFNVELGDLIPMQEEEVQKAKPPRIRRDLDAPILVEKELHLLGMRVEAALAAVKKYIDEAVLSDLEEVRLIHGFGTGALQKAIAELLRTHPSVASFRLGGKGEGGEGATVVKLK